MDAKFILITAAVGLACFVLGLLVRGRRRDERMIVQRAPFTSAAQPGEVSSSYGVGAGGDGGVNLQLGRDLEQLLAAGKKIEAIKLVRERTGMGLKESKEAVERLEELMKRLGS